MRLGVVMNRASTNIYREVSLERAMSIEPTPLSPITGLDSINQPCPQISHYQSNILSPPVQ